MSITTATKIQILDETTANQIAAGEVVERPASAVKELVENALDAGARHVTVELEEGGKYLIRVTDDGCGMVQEDAILSLQRHATSKIRLADDLFRITTMGFRGEALPSIASVSQFSIVTKAAEDESEAATEVVCSGGSVERVGAVGARHGTCITVENLFYNVPARLKFLKTSATELNHIVEMMHRFALSSPGTAFRLLHHGQELFASPGNGSLIDACVQVFGRDTARHLAPIGWEKGSVGVSGFIGTPAALKSSRSSQFTFVNSRFIRNKAVTRALDEAYKSVQTIHGAKYPVAVLLISVDPSQVDVNVSPTKTEVRFTREGEVYQAVYNGVREALMAGGLVPTIAGRTGGAASCGPAGARAVQPVLSEPGESFPTSWADPSASRPSGWTESTSAPVRNGAPPLPQSLLDIGDPFDDDPRFSHVGDSGVGMPVQGDRHGTQTPSRPNSSQSEGRSDFRDGAFIAPGTAPVASAVGTDRRRQSLDSIEVLAQTRNRYILAQTKDALLLIDQHIAHERVLYERLIAGAEGGGTGVPVQHLVVPFTLELSKREAMVVEKRLDDLRKAGFELEPFGGEAFVVRSVPASVAQKHIKAQGGAEAVLREIVDEMVEKTVSRRLLLPAEEVLITASCKMAVKAGDPMTMPEMRALIADLLKSENPYTCPHGRPIIVELPNGDLDRKFGR
jgi:DNA mismatch repair protein MutL